MYKALITDLDGTAIPLASDGSGIDEATQQAVARALVNGKKIACATGRSWRTTKPIVRKLGITSPCVVEGGTRMIDPVTEETLWQKKLEHGIPNKILSVFKAETEIGGIYLSGDEQRRDILTVDSLPDATPFVYILGVTEVSAVAISNVINGETEQYGVSHFTPSWYGKGLVDIHVTHPEATKEHAIREWQRREGVTVEETIGMGDSGNDLPIFLAAGLKVAVSNGTSNLKELADYIAPIAEEQALKHIIDKFLLAA